MARDISPPYLLELHRNLNPKHGPHMSLRSFRGSHPYPVTLTRSGYWCHKTSTCSPYGYRNWVPPQPSLATEATVILTQWGGGKVTSLFYSSGIMVALMFPLSMLHIKGYQSHKPSTHGPRMQGRHLPHLTPPRMETTNQEAPKCLIDIGQISVVPIIENMVIDTNSLSYPVQIQPQKFLSKLLKFCELIETITAHTRPALAQTRQNSSTKKWAWTQSSTPN